MTGSAPKRRVLIITGAGASINLGAGGRPLPLMSGWATDLVSALGIRAQQIGLHPDMPGDEFEAKLGSFLAFERALPIIGQFGFMGAPGQPGMGVDGNFQSWFNIASSAVRDIRLELWRNLWQTFGRDRVDDEAAALAYHRLHSLLRAADEPGTAECYIGHATTNYDTAIETALDQEPSLFAVDGFRNRSGGGSAVYTPETITSTMEDTTNAVPVIHIHGAVGWYYRDDGSINRLPADEGFDDRRRPALLLPDDTKGPETFTDAESETWRQFKRLLGRSTHVLFLGHSLHDRHIVEAVIERSAPTAAVVHTVPDETGRYPKPEDAMVAECVSKIPGLVTFAGEFGKQSKFDDIDHGPLITWLRDTTPDTP